MQGQEDWNEARTVPFCEAGECQKPTGVVVLDSGECLCWGHVSALVARAMATATEKVFP